MSGSGARRAAELLPGFRELREEPRISTEGRGSIGYTPALLALGVEGREGPRSYTKYAEGIGYTLTAPLGRLSRSS